MTLHADMCGAADQVVHFSVNPQVHGNDSEACKLKYKSLARAQIMLADYGWKRSL